MATSSNDRPSRRSAARRPFADRDDSASDEVVRLKDAQGRARYGPLPALVDEIIREAQERGAFDDLPGKGKPLQLEDNPYAPDAWLINGILKQNGILPEWIELDKHIRAELAWLSEHPHHPDRAQRIEALNRMIDRFNLIAPSASLHRRRFRDDDAGR